jgi:hypothetical protein
VPSSSPVFAFHIWNRIALFFFGTVTSRDESSLRTVPFGVDPAKL